MIESWYRCVAGRNIFIPGFLHVLKETNEDPDLRDLYLDTVASVNCSLNQSSYSVYISGPGVGSGWVNGSMCVECGVTLRAAAIASSTACLDENGTQV